MLKRIFNKTGNALLFCSLLALATFQISAQIPSGAWRDHLPYRHGERLAQYNDKIFCLTSDGSLFSYNNSDHSIKKHSKVNGLSDADASAIGYSELTNAFFIGYYNGNIDLVINDSVINIPDIKRKMIMGDKTINNVYFSGYYAYLACGFGIVVCDLAKREIKDTYLFGPGGTQINVNDITSDGNNLIAATKSGIYKASLSSPNLLDFNAWEKLSTLPDPDAEYRFVVIYNGMLFTVYSNPLSGFDDIIVVSGNDWEVWGKSYADKFDYLGSQSERLIISSTGRTKIYGTAEQLSGDFQTYYAKHALFDQSSKGLWYVNPDEGLVKLDMNGNGIIIAPDGPAYRDVADIEIESGSLWAGGGTFASKWQGYGAYRFNDEKWTAFSGATIPALNNFLNISEISIEPSDPSHVIAGSYGYGIVEFRDGELTEIEDETGGILQPVTGFENEPGYVRITGTCFDSDGNIYASATNSETAVYRKMRGQDWEAVQLDYEGFGFTTNVGEILAASNGQFWLLVGDGGILIFREDGNGSYEERYFTVKNQYGTLLDQVFTVAEDHDGNIWVGTSKGPLVYYNPDGIFEEESVEGNQPTIPRNDGTEYVSLLLSTEKINDIEIDGADQKWLATEKSGVFLVSPDGKTEIHHFTEENSPLLSNNVQTVAANDKTGEVFFGTEKGIVSFRGVATEGGDDFKKVYVFPNPVRETYEGDITVTGLAANVNVKITDIAGNLVFETTSLGGQALWNGRNFRGQRVQTGVYLVFCTNKDGTKSTVTKLLFIH